jgi:hypothetical protein
MTTKTSSLAASMSDSFISALSAYITLYRSQLAVGETMGYEIGRRYVRLFIVDQTGSRSAVAFVDVDGSILKSASWKAPAKGVRGSIYNLGSAPLSRAQFYRC